jgi:hypothetical protein
MEVKDIRYTGKQFTDYRTQLVDFTKTYFPKTYSDFSTNSPGMMYIEMAAYVGDVLSFFQDVQIQETYTQLVQEPKNVYNLAYASGYFPKVNTVSEVEVEVSHLVDADANGLPNWDQALSIGVDTVFRASTNSNIPFLLRDRVDFSYSSSLNPTEVVIYEVSNTAPVSYRLTKKARCYSGEIKSINYVIGTPTKYTTLEINDTGIVGVFSIEDSDENIWTEVPYLGQNTVFTQTPNSLSSSYTVPNILSISETSKRFVARFTSETSLNVQFGAGVTNSSDLDILPNPKNVGVGTIDNVSKIDTAYDPVNFLYSKGYGEAPANTTLTVRYLKSYGRSGNVPANSISIISAVYLESTNNVKESTLTVTNIEPAQGGQDSDSIDEIRQNALKANTEQLRLVTTGDYYVRAKSLPPQFGTISQCYVELGENYVQRGSNLPNVNIYVLSEDSAGKLIECNALLKQNLVTYLTQYISLTDTITIRDAFIVNIGVTYSITLSPGYHGKTVLTECNKVVASYFNPDKRKINDIINISKLRTVLDNVKGVETVVNIEVNNKANGEYSKYSYDLSNAIKSSIIYPSIDPCYFEIKYPTKDIVGTVVSI